MNPVIKTKIPDFLAGGGEMGQRIRNFDWSNTPLGNPLTWEQSLKTCVRIMLASTQPIWIGWGKDLIKLYNDPYKAIVRGKHPGALGQPASVVWKDIWKDIEPMLEKVMVHDTGTYVESQLLIMERSGYPEETYYTFSYTPVLGDNGKPAGMICFNTDDTERIIGERQLLTLRELSNITTLNKTENDLYKEVALALEKNNKDFPLGLIYKIDNNTNTANIAAYVGIDKGQHVFLNEINTAHPVEGSHNFCKAVQTGKPVLSLNNGRWKNIPLGGWEKEAAYFLHLPITPTGQHHPFANIALALNPYRKFDSSFEQFTKLIADQVSLHLSNIMAVEQERKRAEELAELDQAKTIFFSNISHEFRTPLTLLLGPLEDILNDKTFAGSKREHIEVAHRNAMRLLKLVNTLLEVSRIESGKQKATYVRTDLATFTTNLVENFRAVTEKAGVALLIKIPNQTQPVYVDRDMWEKIVFNLLSNAFKYTLKGSITVTLSYKKQEVVLVVKDTGLGIPAKELPHMFERFHRVKNAAGRTFEGSGIGLSLIKELIQLHGGHISVESTEGKGSTFSVAIPVGKDHLPAENILEDEKTMQAAHSTMYVDEATSILNANSELANGKAAPVFLPEIQQRSSILIVDDNADMREYIKTLLQRNFKIYTAANGQEALDKINSIRPTLVISDIMMPVMDGIELLKAIKTTPEHATLPVILLTARAGEESLLEGYETGADDYLVKPFSARELIARANAQISIAEKRKAIETELEHKVKDRTLELERSNQELESFNYIASHDLQEPLRKIQTFIALLTENKEDETLWNKYYNRINDSARQMSELIQSVLDYTRVSHNEENFKKVDLNQILESVTADFEVVINERHVTINSSRLPTIPAIPVQIKQLFSNLISNSIKFSEQDPVITITSEIVNSKALPAYAETRHDKFVMLKFTDNGIGFEPQYKEKIFKLFQRLHSKSEYSGTGIGLSIVNKIVEKHKGFLKAESTPGKGASFTIWLPAE